jgi:hypothetical protein
LKLPKHESRSVVVNAGTVRMNIVYRIYPGRKMKKLLQPIDEVEERIR